jgi:hypothetical protein
MRETNLNPESGAEFFGKIECLDEQRLFRASCYAQVQRQGELGSGPIKVLADRWIS